MHNPHLLALLAKIPEKSVVIVEHDSVGYLDPDVRAVLDDFAENAPQRGIRLNQCGRWPPLTLTEGGWVRPLRDPSDCRKRPGIPCFTPFLGYHCQPKE